MSISIFTGDLFNWHKAKWLRQDKKMKTCAVLQNNPAYLLPVQKHDDNFATWINSDLLQKVFENTL